MIHLFKSGFVALVFVTIVICDGYAQPGAWKNKSPQERAAIETRNIRKQLNLSAEQLNEAEEITAHKHTAIDELMRDKDEDTEDRRDKLLAIWQDWDKEMQQILEDGQARAYAELKMEYKEKLFAAFDKKTGNATNDAHSSGMDADIMEEEYEEIEEEIENEENLEDALQGAEDVEFE